MTQPGDVSWLRLLLACLVTLGLLAALAGVLKYLGMRGLTLPGAPGRARRLRLIESLPLDTRRRVVIVACDGREHLLLLGANTDTVIASNPALSPES